MDAYNSCRKNKTNKLTTKEFDLDFVCNLNELYVDLITNNYKITQSIKFVVTYPRPREIWAANFRDRVVQHIVYNRIKDFYFKRFIYDSCACIPTKGTHFGVTRLKSKISSITENWTKPAYYLKCDYANFFVSIDKKVLIDLLQKQIQHTNVLNLLVQIINHNPTLDYIDNSDDYKNSLVPKHKSLLSYDNNGLAIGNITSQLLANILLDVIDQYCKRELKIKYYIRYVDDIIILGNNTKELNIIFNKLKHKSKELNLEFNTIKTQIHSVYRGVDFVGQVVKPHRTQIRDKTLNNAYKAIYTYKPESYPSYLGVLKQGNNHKLYIEYKNSTKL